MADSSEIESSVVVATQTNTERITVPGSTLPSSSVLKLSPRYPYSAETGALKMSGNVNALENVATMTTRVGYEVPTLIAWLYLAPVQKYRLSFEFSPWDYNPPIEYRCVMPNKSQISFPPHEFAFEFVPPSLGWHEFGVYGKRTAGSASFEWARYTFHSCKLTHLGPLLIGPTE